MVSRQIKIVENDLERFTERAMKELTFEAHANMAEATPVDLGWARNNFVPEIGAPFDGTAGTAEQAKEGNLDASTANSGLAKIATSYRLARGPIFITNNVPYIGRLNDGSSTQAPAGFIQKGTAKAVATVSARLSQ